MLISWQDASIWLILLWLCTTSSSLCPSYCTCKPDEKGRKKVSCQSGGMIQIPTKKVDANIEILEIDAPEKNWNILTVSPIFQHLKRLEELSIRRSNIHQIGMHSFWGVPTLKSIDLRFNNITSLFDHNFRGLVNLAELNLDHNFISNLQSGVFKHLTELRILSLKFNLLTELVPKLFMKLGKLHVLKLTGNPFEELDPEAFKDIPDLRFLECRSCGLRRINTQIYHLLPYLNFLDLGGNRMQFLESDEFIDLRKIETLKLDENQLPVILENTFRHQTQLKFLTLSRNRLAKITSSAFKNLTSIEELDISYNKLSSLDAKTVHYFADSLKKFKMSGNRFSLLVIRDVVQTLHKITELEIAQMGIRELPHEFFRDKIRKLNVSKNNLSDISVEMLPEKLEVLDVSHNKLKGLDEREILKFERMKSVILNPNPWSCDLCSITSILLRSNRTSLFENSTCSSPKHLKGALLKKLQLSDLRSCENVRNEGEMEQNSGENKSGIFIGVIFFAVFLLFSVIYVVYSCTRRRTLNLREQEKRDRERRNVSLSDPVAVFSKDNITFKFPLDLTDNRVSVCTIDNIKTDVNIPNGTVI